MYVYVCTLVYRKGLLQFCFKQNGQTLSTEDTRNTFDLNETTLRLRFTGKLDSER